MAIGYYNFGNIQQGNQSVVNSMLGLGKQISSAIENHAATESAKAMLPMLQQQYQTGMAKIAAGHSDGLGDIYQASMVASQNPILAPMANHAINLANSANQQTQHTLRTRAAQEGALIRAGMAHPGSYDANGNYIPAAKQAAPITGSEQAKINQKNLFMGHALWNGTDKMSGAKEGLEDFLNNKASDKSQDFLGKLNTYQEMKKQNPSFINQDFENALHAKKAITDGVITPVDALYRLKGGKPKSMPSATPASAPKNGMIPAAAGGLTQADQEDPQTSAEYQADQEELRNSEEDQSII